MFKNKVKIEVFYFDTKYRSSHYGFGEKKHTIENSKPLRDSWCFPKQPPIKLVEKNATNGTVDWKANETGLGWILNETMLNDQFSLCLDYHHYHHQNRSRFEAFDSDLSCRVDIIHYSPSSTESKQNRTCDKAKSYTHNFKTCSFQWNDTLKIGWLTINDSEKGLSDMQKSKNHFTSYNSGDSDTYVNVMCFIRDTSYYNKYIFNQPIIVSPQETITRTQVNQESTRPTTNIETSPNPPSDATVAIFFIVMVLSLTAAVFLIIQYYRKKAKINATNRAWEMNPLYHSEESDAEENNNEESFLPQWLTNKPDMIYQPKCLVQGEALGHGQYGTVYKGKLTQGNAV